MDHFGIGAAIRGAIDVYICAARRTGRTTALLESLKDGDRVVCHETKHQRELQRLCRERKLNVEVILVPVTKPEDVFMRGTSEGRTLFDHAWLEAYYADVVEEAAKRVDYWQTQSSGYGTAHIRTRQAAIELSKWGKL